MPYKSVAIVISTRESRKEPETGVVILVLLYWVDPLQLFDSP